MIKTTNNKKSGFSLFEALVSMLILSLFFLAASKAITQKQPVEIQRNPHGIFECYKVQGQLWQHRVVGPVSTPAKRVGTCIFNPPNGVNFINIHYFDGTRYFNGQQLIMNDSDSIPSMTDPGVLFQNRKYAFNDPDREFNPEEDDQDVNNFKTYLKLAHPNSSIYKSWAQNNPPQSALILAW